MPEYKPQARDVHESVDRELFRGLRALTPVERLELAMRAIQAEQELSIAGLRLRFPDADDEELRRRAGALRLGPKLSKQLFGTEDGSWPEQSDSARAQP